MRIRNEIIDLLRQTVLKCMESGRLPQAELPPINLQVPDKKEFGDYYSNVALVLSPLVKASPRHVANILADVFPVNPKWVKSVEVAGPGFLNFHLDSGWLYYALELIHSQGHEYGRTDHGKKTKVLVEFISANPTGPMNVVSARAGAVGDSLCNLLHMAGYDVWREFYVNDAGNQVQTLGESLEVRYRQALGQDLVLPENAYPGEYLVNIARELVDEKGASLLRLDETERSEIFSTHAINHILLSQKRSLELYGVKFDRWFSEKSLHEQNAISKTLDFLTERGYTYVQDGALWFKSSAFGDDKDRVLVKNDGLPTYFAPDIAYHHNKLQRGFNILIDIWGPDHHGYIPRMKAAMKALGHADTLEVLIVQMVRLIREKETVRMSKRAGEFVTLDDLLEDVGKDVARFFFLMRSQESHLDFDLDLGRLQTSENPVYYVQYAHARISSIFREAQERGHHYAPTEVSPALLTDDTEIDLIRKLAEFPEEIIQAANAREPHRITRYLIDIATLFHAFYTRCRILGDDPGLTNSRLHLARATQIVLRNALTAIGVSAPDKM